MSDKLDKLEEQLLEEDDNAEIPPAEIVAYNELRSCADLYRMRAQGILEIQPEFQREIVWPGTAQTRLIDSLVKQLPIPSMCFALDYKQQKWMVIDGLQRIATIVRFLDGGDWILSRLDDIDSGLAGKSVAAIKTAKDDLHKYYTRVENLTIPITVLRCDFQNKSHLEYLFTIFHRLNTGGMKLNNQEIRNCVYGGPFNDLLRELDRDSNWRLANKMQPNQLYRFTKQELILRFFAFHAGLESYDGHLAKFLNTYMYTNRNADEGFLAQKRTLFARTAECLWVKALKTQDQGKLSLTLLEGALVGIGRNIDLLESSEAAVVSTRFQTLRGHEQYSEGSLIEGLSKRAKVIARLTTAVRVFAGAA